MTLREILAKKDALKAKGLAILKAAKEREDKVSSRRKSRPSTTASWRRSRSWNPRPSCLPTNRNWSAPPGRLHSANPRRTSPFTTTSKMTQRAASRATPISFTAVMSAGNGRAVDERLYKFKAVQGTDEQSTTQDPYGGFLGAA